MSIETLYREYSGLTDLPHEVKPQRPLPCIPQEATVLADVKRLVDAVPEEAMPPIDFADSVTAQMEPLGDVPRGPVAYAHGVESFMTQRSFYPHSNSQEIGWITYMREKKGATTVTLLSAREMSGRETDMLIRQSPKSTVVTVYQAGGLTEVSTNAPKRKI